MHVGFQSMRDEIQRLAFVPAAVPAADRSGDTDRIRRLKDETKEREGGMAVADQRAWQARMSLILALIGLPLSIIGSVVVALILTHMK